jgi:hypothetical protein
MEPIMPISLCRVRTAVYPMPVKSSIATTTVVQKRALRVMRRRKRTGVGGRSCPRSSRSEGSERMRA